MRTGIFACIAAPAVNSSCCNAVDAVDPDIEKGLVYVRYLRHLLKLGLLELLQDNRL